MTDPTLNRIPLSTIGVTMLAGSYQALLAPTALKDFVENDDPLKNGVEVIVQNPVLKERDVTLTFLVKGSDEPSFFQNYNRFIAELYKGNVELYIPDLGQYYRLLYRNSTQYENYQLNACKMAVKFREPNPANRSKE